VLLSTIQKKFAARLNRVRALIAILTLFSARLKKVLYSAFARNSKIFRWEAEQNTVLLIAIAKLFSARLNKNSAFGCSSKISSAG
jgi:uncharacterized membrane protein